MNRTRVFSAIVAFSVCLSFSRTGMTDSGSTSWFAQSEGAWREKLSPVQYEIVYEGDVKVPMRDGKELSANIWRPKAEGRFPVIFMYTPYDNTTKSPFLQGDMIGHAEYFVPRGYVFGAIDVRGRYDSEGESYLYWDPEWRQGKYDGLDVYDCQTWLGEQPWSTGKIGMSGGSYLGFVQWMGAPLGNPNLAALIPYVSPDDHYDNVYPSGAFQLSNSVGLLATLHGRNNIRDLQNYFFKWTELYNHLPLRTLDVAMLGKKTQLWQDWIDHPDNDEYWRFSVGDRLRAGEMGPGRYADVKVPTLNITGWYDQVSQATINNYIGMVRYGPQELREKHHLIVGPWTHGVGPRVVGDKDFGPDAEVDFKPIELRWFDYWLKGIPNGLMDEPPVHIFVMQENRWRSEEAWPTNRTQDTKYYLHSGGAANSRSGNGSLSTEAPGSEPADRFVYDPLDPVFTNGGNISIRGLANAGVRDQRPLQRRADVLVYTGSLLDEPTEVTGRILVRLFASSSARDTDFTAKLVDTHPDGYAQMITEGIVRARYRESYKRQEFIEPGNVYEFVIDLWSTSHVFRQGHRIVVEISSSNFPKYDRNPNTGHRFGESAETVKATQTVYHTSEYPSHIVLPVVKSAEGN